MADPTPSAAARPLSPHLQIYRWTWTMAMSIAHRVTGVALFAGALLLAVWLVALATSPEVFATLQAALGSIPGRLVLFGYTWALIHHMLGGVRHLVWDLGIGYGRAARMNLARATLIGSVLLTLAVWALAYSLR